jgi:hypothetical protein
MVQALEKLYADFIVSAQNGRDGAAWILAKGAAPGQIMRGS